MMTMLDAVALQMSASPTAAGMYMSDARMNELVLWVWRHPLGTLRRTDDCIHDELMVVVHMGLMVAETSRYADHSYARFHLTDLGREVACGIEVLAALEDSP